MFLKFNLLLLFIFTVLQISKNQELKAQQSVGLFGTVQSLNNENFRLNSFESNPVNYSKIRDWEFVLNYGAVLTKNAIAGNFFLIILSKRFGDHFMTARITPGYKMQFNYNTGTAVVYSDTAQVLKTSLSYEEKFGFGYSYNFSNRLTAGFTMRYYSEELNEETVDPYFSDTLSLFYTGSDVFKTKYWRGDIGINYKPTDNLALSLSSANLFIYKETEEKHVDFDYSMNTQKSAIIGLDYYPDQNFMLSGRYESSNSFLLGTNFNTKLFNGNFGIGITAFHSNSQKPFVAGILPSINFSTSAFSFTLSGIKYFSDRNSAFTIDEFQKYRVDNLLSNRFSTERISFTVNLALSFIPEQQVKFIDLEITDEIYPTLSGIYLSKPVASAKTVNISDEKAEVYPSSYIPLLNSDRIQSPSVIVLPGDTAEIFFYTLVDKEKVDVIKRQIAQGNFYLYTQTGELNDEKQKPVLVNDRNGWNGNIESLKYFISADYEFAIEYSKNILSEKKDSINKTKSNLKNFIKTKILFNEFVKNLSYVSDPRTTAEYVQFPSQTFNLKGGDCDDLSVALSSILEAAGIQTAFVDYRSDEGLSHVNLLVNTNLKPEESGLITINDKKFYVRKNISGADEIWIPVEATSLTDFERAWSAGSEKFYNEGITEMGLSKGTVRIVDIN